MEWEGMASSGWDKGREKCNDMDGKGWDKIGWIETEWDSTRYERERMG